MRISASKLDVVCFDPSVTCRMKNVACEMMSNGQKYASDMMSSDLKTEPQDLLHVFSRSFAVSVVFGLFMIYFKYGRYRQ